MSRAERPRHPLPTRVDPPARIELPTRIEETIPLPDTYAAELARGLGDLGIVLRPAERAVIDGHARLLLAWTRAINLTAIRDPADVARLHVIDSLAGLASVAGEGPPPATLLDVGSGGGYPGIVLAAMLPETRVVLADSVGKKVRFLETVVAATGIDGRVEALAARAEMLAMDVRHRASYDVVVVRAVGTLADLVELSLPLLRVGGRLIAWKRGSLDGDLGAELTAAERACAAVGGERPQIVPVAVAGLDGHVIVVIGKRGSTDAAYPRDPALRRRHPL